MLSAERPLDLKACVSLEEEVLLNPKSPSYLLQYLVCVLREC